MIDKIWIHSVFTLVKTFLGNLEIIITYLLRPRETVCFVDPRPPLPEAKPRATTAVEGPQNTLLSRGLSK
jgi:hypothetical protein